MRQNLMDVTTFNGNQTSNMRFMDLKSINVSLNTMKKKNLIKNFFLNKPKFLIN